MKAERYPAEVSLHSLSYSLKVSIAASLLSKQGRLTAIFSDLGPSKILKSPPLSYHRHYTGARATAIQSNRSDYNNPLPMTHHATRHDSTYFYDYRCGYNICVLHLLYDYIPAFPIVRPCGPI